MNRSGPFDALGYPAGEEPPRLDDDDPRFIEPSPRCTRGQQEKCMTDAPLTPEALLNAYDDARRKLDYSNRKWPSHQATFEAMTMARMAVLTALRERRS